jgi:CBS domain-containing protein
LELTREALAATSQRLLAMVDTVRSIVQRKGSTVWSVAPETTVYEAIKRMAEKGVGALMVVEEERLVGVISERDYARKVILKGKSSRDTRVRDIMSAPVITVTPEHSVEECLAIVTQHRIRHLPVLEEGRLAGVVTIGDLVGALIAAQADTIHHLSSYISGKYPG